MSWSMAFFTFLNAWWIMLFFVLPFGVKPSDGSNPHEYAAAPQTVDWKKKIMQTTLLAILVTAGLAAVINSGLVSVGEPQS